jgi:hypothetical protein
MGIMDREAGVDRVLWAFITDEIEAIDWCGAAISRLAGPDERAVVVALRTAHEAQLGGLRALALAEGLAPFADGAWRSRAVDDLGRAPMRGKDRLVLHALALDEAILIDGYQRELRALRLTVRTRPLFERALAALLVHHQHLLRSARLAA